MSADDRLVRKVKGASLRNFRGWVGETTFDKPLNLDADIVLVASANGRGKSSLVEALARVLNGHAFHDDAANQSRGTQTPWEVRLETNIRRIKHDDKDWRQRLDPERSDVPQPSIVRRATTFLQDRLDDQFEGGRKEGREEALLDFLAPPPDWLKAYDKALQRRLERWRAEQPFEPSATAVQSATRRRNEAADELLAALAPLLDRPPPATGTPMERLAAVVQQITARDARSLRPAEWIEPFRHRLGVDARLGDEHRSRRTYAAERVSRAKRALEEHKQAWPSLAELSGWAHGIVDLDRLLELVEGLAARPERWHHSATIHQRLHDLPEASRRQVPFPDEALTELTAELAQVDRVRAGRYRDALAAWKGFWDERTREHGELGEALAKAEDELRRLQLDAVRAHALAALTTFGDAQNALTAAEELRELAESRQARWRRLEPMIRAADEQHRLIRKLRDRQLGDDVKGQIKASMNAVMRHFVVAGFSGGPKEEIIALFEEGSERSLRPGFVDGRDLDLHFSTGQKAQTALAWLLGTNALLQRWLPHRLLLLDDVSTALDLTNLAAECALLRKFAYTDPKSSRRRQVIVASHHDQLTHRMFDLLLPPKGSTMLEIRIVDWDRDVGPTPESAYIKPTRAADGTSRKELGEYLKTVFADRAALRRAG